MRKLMMLVTLVTIMTVGSTLYASETTSTNTIKIDLTGWENPEEKPPTNPEPPTGSEEIKPPVENEKPKQPGKEKTKPWLNKFLPQTGEIFQNLIYLGLIIVLIAFVAFKNKNKQFKGDL